MGKDRITLKRRTRVISVLFLAAVAVGIVPLYRTVRRGRVTVISEGPLDIRLWGIRPACGDTIYDPQGGKIMDTLGSTAWDWPIWKDNYQKYDFIFEVPETNVPPLFVPITGITDSRGRGLWMREKHRLEYFKGKRLRWVTLTFPRKSSRSILFDSYQVDARVNAVDLKLRYYYGPPGPNLFTLKGPFKPPCEMTSDDGAYKVAFPDEADGLGYQFELKKEGFQDRIPAIAYHNSGRLQFVDVKSWKAHSGEGSRGTYRVKGVSVEQLKQITFDESPCTIAFKNIRLDQGGRRNSGHAKYLDKIAAKLDWEHSVRELADYSFKDADEALEVIDLVRGKLIVNAWKALLGGGKEERPLDPAQLSSEQRERLKQTLNRWTKANDPEIRWAGILVGLFCQWPEFLEPAFDTVDCRDADRAHTGTVRHAAGILHHYRGRLGDEDIDRIKEILLCQDDLWIVRLLQKYLVKRKSPARIKALRELASSDRTWLWWHAIVMLREWEEFEISYDSLPEKIKLRVFLVAGGDGFSDPNQIASKAYSLLPELLTRQLAHYDYRSLFPQVLDLLAENLDHETATAAMIRLLRTVEDYRLAGGRTDERIIKYINLWYDMDIGALGSDLAKRIRFRDREKYDWPKITAEAIDWYENRNAGIDAKSA